MLALQMAEIHLAHSFGLSATQRQSASIRTISILAGSRPQEDLVEIEISASLTGSIPANGRSCSAYECSAGTLRAVCEIEHDIPTVDVRPAIHFAHALDALEPAETRYYGDGFILQKHIIENVSADITNLTSTAQVRIVNSSEQALFGGLEGAMRRVPSFIDTFVVCMHAVSTGTGVRTGQH